MDQSQRMAASRQFAIDSARLLADTRCNQVAVLDVSGISPVTDFLVIATGTSPRQMKTACDDVEEMAQQRDFRPLSHAGDGGANWTCVDFVDVVVHVFSQDARMFYDLDALWGDGQKVEWEKADGK
jgi:ribosome-associated protein